jgi:hypothetical protein
VHLQQLIKHATRLPVPEFAQLQGATWLQFVAEVSDFLQN